MHGGLDLTPLLQAVIALAAGIVTGVVVPWIQARTSITKRELLLGIVRTLVCAAEQLYASGQVRDRLTYVQKGLEARGFFVDTDAIEAAVRELTWIQASAKED